MKTHKFEDSALLKPTALRLRSQGFALVITLSLMILLTVIAVGLLTLSSISLRSATQGDAMQIARANAKMALMLAIGDLQKQLGPDTRVSVTADQTAGTDPAVAKAPQAQRNWAGAYNSWPAALPADARPNPTFLQWFVSGDPKSVLNKNYAETSLTGSTVEIVTKNTVGPEDPVTVPLISQTLANGSKNNLAWWVSDLGTKAFIAPSKTIPVGLGDVRADLQSIPTSSLQTAAVGNIKPFQALAADDVNLAKVLTLPSAAFLADSPENIRGLFHHYSSYNRGLLTNVRAGGFRKDLSMELERPGNGSGATKPPESTATALYQVAGESGINLQELWVYYNSWKEVKRSGSFPFTTGGTLASGSPYVLVDSSPSVSRNDDEFYLKQPVVISYQLVLSLRNASSRLELVADPIITLWNPLDIAVVIPANQPITVKYWQVPYDLLISKNGGPTLSYPLAASLSDANLTNDGDSNFLSLQIGKLGRLVFKPGEVIKFSQSGTAISKASGNRHQLAGKAGFNYGGGVWLPVKSRSGATIPLTPTDTITVEAAPNQFTAGATKQSGTTMEADGTAHSRHFSLTHHEYYYGEDRESNGDSLGIGNMAIDWDFGNRRLKAAEVRQQTAPGTKSSGERIYANNSKFKDIFKRTDKRTLPAAALASKQPLILLSFHAKTERGTSQGTKSLSRFNPKALHVDFYNLSEQERDILPYEYTVEPLASWKSDKLETSTSGNAYFGGGMDAFSGTPFVTTHSFPREPLVSLAAFQHSFANGFDVQKPKYGYATLNAREPMLPQISHAIGNSSASPMLGSGATEGTLPGGRPMADHSYLANQGLWDDWFISGISPQTTGTFSASKPQKTLATEFFSGTTKLPVSRYVPNLGGKTPTELANTYFSGTTPKALATLEMASLLQVNGLFNVNSTSIEAWKSVLGSRRERSLVVRDSSGKDSILKGAADVPVSGLLTPMDTIASGNGSIDTNTESQWVGRRILTDAEIEALAKSIVKEVRKRGPFLSLADFVNRRVGTDTELARAGAVQSALDSTDHNINSAYNTGARAVSGASSRFAFPEAEQGAISQGMPGIVKQADILTPIAPVMSVRSDSFLIRAYGEKTDSTGKVVAKTWCEAIIQRSAQFVDPSDQPEKAYNSISTVSKNFGRRFDIVSFRWLSPSEA